MSIVLTLGHSPDPDDVFMWWPITGMLAPDGVRLTDARGRPRLDTAPFTFEPVVADIESLNTRAIERGDLDITAISAAAYPAAARRYAVLASGASFGDGCGPRVIVRSDMSWPPAADRPLRLAIPGLRTTACLVFRMLMNLPVELLAMSFDAVPQAVVRGDADAGLLIHDVQLAVGEGSALRQVLDLGQAWSARTGYPLPLGLNAGRRDLEARVGPGAADRVADILKRSICWALEHWSVSLRYAATFARPVPGESVVPLDRVQRFVSQYVNAWSIDMGTVGRDAIERLFRDAAEAGLLSPTPSLVG